MPRASACLLLASFALSFGMMEMAAAQSGIRHAAPGAPAVRTNDHSSSASHFRGDARQPTHRFHRRHGVLPRLGVWPWIYAEATDDFDPAIVEESPPPPPNRVLTGIPSISELPVSTGIRSEPPGSPTIYVLDSRGRALRRSGAKIVNMDETESETTPEGAGPRIIHLDVPVGR